METISLKPDKKLKTKQFLTLLTLTGMVLLIGAILQLTIPLGGKVTGGQVSIIVWPIVFGVILLKWIIAAPIIILWIKNLEYFIEEERIRIHKGILTKIQQNIPYRAVTDFQLHRSLYDRFLGMGSIRIQTAGQTQSPTGYEANMAGLPEWNNLMLELRKRVKKFHGEAVEDSEAESQTLIPNQLSAEILEELKKIREVLERK